MWYGGPPVTTMMSWSEGLVTVTRIWRTAVVSLALTRRGVTVAWTRNPRSVLGSSPLHPISKEAAIRADTVLIEGSHRWRWKLEEGGYKRKDAARHEQRRDGAADGRAGEPN